MQRPDACRMHDGCGWQAGYVYLELELTIFAIRSLGKRDLQAIPHTHTHTRTHARTHTHTIRERETNKVGVFNAVLVNECE